MAKDMAKTHKYLKQRGKTYAIRVPVPKNLQNIIGKKEITRSLKAPGQNYGTRDKGQAEKLYPDVLKSVYRVFEKAEAELNATQNNNLEGFDPLQTVRLWHFKRREEVMVRTKAMFSNEEELKDYKCRLRSELVELSSSNLDRRYNFVERVAHGLLSDAGVPMCSDNKIPVVDVTNIKYHDLHEHLIASMTELKELELMRLGERIQFTPNGRVFEFPLPSLTLPAVRERVGTPLSKLIEEFLTHSGGTGKPKTVNDKIAAYNYLISIAGKEFYVEDLTRDHFVKIRKLLSAYPKNANKINALKNLSLADRVEYAKRHDLPCMKKANANKIIAWLKRLMGYAVATGKISQNPCLELEFHISQAEREEGQWQPFNIGQLNRLFSSPAFSLDYPSGAAMYWVPLIALFHGFRMEEILLLTTNEIKRAEDNKTLYFDLTNFTTDELKNSNARRRVPFHRELFLLGFDEYLADCKKYKETRLFPELQRAKGADDSYRKIFSQKFSRYLSAQGIKTKRVVFHSFRKNFSVACTNGGVPVDIENALAGWSLVGGQGGTYKKPRDISPIKLKSMIDCVEYTGLKLSHLYK